ncbi:hypothetical protein BHE74_00050984 [Ensete ventricosum]|nr:hypothetical protein BHE74_00050984 [Ensete ventricosum]
MEVSNFVEMLRSASEDERKAKEHGTSHNDWKVKQDTDQLRVMYREGPHGTPFHTLLAEGYADGPIDVYSEKIEVSIDGFNRNEVPKAIRIDLVGGFSYFPAHSLYQVLASTNTSIGALQAVGTVATTDQDYRKALEGPMYARIREEMNPKHKTKTDVVGLEEEKYEGPLPKEHIGEAATEVQSIIDNRYISEIVEEETEHSTLSSTKQQDLITKRVYISPEVEVALGILDNAISILRKKGSPNNQLDCSSVDEGFPTYEAALEASETKSSTRNSSDNPKTSAFGNKLTVLGPETADSSSSHIKPTQSAISMTKPTLLESLNKVCDEGSLKANGFHDKSLKGGGKSKHSRKKWFCCSIR